MQRLELLDSFGGHLHQYRSELKGSTLLDRKRFRFAQQLAPMEPEARRKHCRGFSHERPSNTRLRPGGKFTAYGQACLEMARGVFQLLRQHHAVLFAAAIPPIARPRELQLEEYLRKDQVFLLERFFYFLESQKEHGLLVVDEVDTGARPAVYKATGGVFHEDKHRALSHTMDRAQPILRGFGHDLSHAGRGSYYPGKKVSHPCTY